MQRIPVESSDIVSIGYDAENLLLEIEFNGGRTYQYRNVVPEIHAQLMAADSHGQYFNTFIHGRYRYERTKESDDTTDPIKTLAFVTGNGRKFRDLQAACAGFGIEVEQVDLPVDEIQSTDASEIAIKKAKQAYKLAGHPVVVNDVFWNILALHGFPGAYMKDMVNWLQSEDFLKLMEGKTVRTITGIDTLVYYDGKRTKEFSQEYTGTLTEEPRGEGNPVDRIMVLAGETRTVAEIENQEGRSSIEPLETIWHDFAKWYNMQRRLGKV